MDLIIQQDVKGPMILRQFPKIPFEKVVAVIFGAMEDNHNWL